MLFVFLYIPLYSLVSTSLPHFSTSTLSFVSPLFSPSPLLLSSFSHLFLFITPILSLLLSFLYLFSHYSSSYSPIHSPSLPFPLLVFLLSTPLSFFILSPFLPFLYFPSHLLIFLSHSFTSLPLHPPSPPLFSSSPSPSLPLFILSPTLLLGCLVFLNQQVNKRF